MIALDRDTTISDILSMIERRAPDMMRYGGGPISREGITNMPPVSPEVLATFQKLKDAGTSLYQISEVTGYSYHVVCRKLRDARRG
jgi:hypothetical protein